jgi:hypothetical protein
MICCALCRSKRPGKRKGHVEIISFIKSTQKRATQPRNPGAPFHYNENEAFALAESLGEREGKAHEN